MNGTVKIQLATHQLATHRLATPPAIFVTLPLRRPKDRNIKLSL
jgi:hypothetical protein